MAMIMALSTAMMENGVKPSKSTRRMTAKSRRARSMRICARGPSRNSRAYAQLNDCYISVAMAAPATPIWKKTTSTMSSTILIKQQTIKKYSGLRLSPTARRMPAPTL